jgi:adenylate cyclase
MARRLAAILATDVVGYSSLMAEDEAGTLAALRAHRVELFNPETEKRGGRIVKLMGDGALVEFLSVVDAVECALAIQQALVDSGGPIRLRIGINLGDVILDGDDIYGEGVNVAARLEGLAESGGICISSIVRESIGNRVGAEFADAGEHEVKGLSRPIPVWRWPAEGVAAGMAVPPALPDKPSIAVLPFKNMSGDAEQKYFSDGVTEDIITELSRFHRLSIMSAVSSSRYRDTVNTPNAVRNPGAQFLVDGSVRRLGGRLRITSKLLDATTGNQLWAERFDRDIEQIFAVQDEIVQRIVGTRPGQSAPDVNSLPVLTPMNAFSGARHARLETRTQRRRRGGSTSARSNLIPATLSRIRFWRICSHSNGFGTSLTPTSCSIKPSSSPSTPWRSMRTSPIARISSVGSTFTVDRSTWQSGTTGVRWSLIRMTRSKSPTWVYCTRSSEI